ncbi:MAG: RICIN domain-containing protein, partial [Myxococcales bacterium]|nr:RICIN domain-containing protein [Myxococcales bacterium]
MRARSASSLVALLVLLVPTTLVVTSAGRSTAAEGDDVPAFSPATWHRLTTLWQGDGKCLDIINDAKDKYPQLATCGNYKGQAWKLTPDRGYYRLTTKWRGDDMCLDVINDGKRNDRLQLAPCGNY